MSPGCGSFGTVVPNRVAIAAVVPTKAKRRIAMRCKMLVLAAAIFVLPAYANAQEFHAKFSGFKEVGALNNETGAILSDGQATLKLKLDRKLQSLTYTLTYSDLVAVQQAHIHFGKVHVAGGILVFLCTNLANGPVGTPACPATAGTVSGLLTPASVVAIPGQNVAAGNFDAVSAALLSNTAYGNIHTAAFPRGEIRGEVRRGKDDEDRRGKDDD
jgi:CHRD domain-containing protein